MDAVCYDESCTSTAQAAIIHHGLFLLSDNLLRHPTRAGILARSSARLFPQRGTTRRWRQSKSRKAAILLSHFIPRSCKSIAYACPPTRSHVRNTPRDTEQASVLLVSPSSTRTGKHSEVLAIPVYNDAG